jgi:hypothetical protein
VSAAVLQSLASAAAATIYDAIGVAETGAELDKLSKLAWCGFGDGAISDNDLHRLLEYIDLRRPLRRTARQSTLPGLPRPEPNLCRVGAFPKRRVQRSPNKQKSYERRHRLAYSGVMPGHLAARLTIGQIAVMSVVGDEYRRVGRCELALETMAARAGVCRKTARRAMATAREERLITIEIRPVRGKKNRPNLVEIISFEWLKWLLRSRTRQTPGSRPIGGHLVSPTDTTPADGNRCNADFEKAAAPPKPPQRGQPTKEAIAFADELANIAGYRRATTPDSWRKANPSQVVQVWLNELGKYQLDRRPLDVLRAVAVGVMRRKRARDRSPPHSPRYFGSEVYKLIEGMERATREFSEFNSRPMKRLRLQPTRNTTKRVA